MAEVYDADASIEPQGRLVNLSARAHASSGSGVLIIGFVIAGDEPLKVLLRGIGPSLHARGISSAMVDPQLDLFRGNARLQHNDNWDGSVELAAAFSRTGAFDLPDLRSKDAAMIVTLEPGAYTAIVTGVNGTEGIALAEVYELR
jgi:hypothetical protein